MRSDVALICGKGATSLAVANALSTRFGKVPILVEGKESRAKFLGRRIRRLGFFKVLGQLAFISTIPPILQRLSRARIAEIVRESGLTLSSEVLADAKQVESANSAEAIGWLKALEPKVVVINGTRILSRRVLSATDAIFMNTHCGVTPEYRGTHGGYWALRSGKIEACGVTVHLVDAGIDTGDILAQQVIHPTSQDNFATYPYLQIAAAIPDLLRSVDDALQGRHKPYRREGESCLWYHPTLWEYLVAGLRGRVW